MKLKNTFILIFFVLVSQAFTCGEEDEQATNCGNREVVLKFDIKFSISPLIDTIAVGDTLWLVSEIPNEFLELNSGTYVDVANHDFKIKSGFAWLQSAELLDADNDFMVINEQGRFVKQNVGTGVVRSSLEYEFGVERQSLRVGFVPQKAGISQISFYNLTEDLGCEAIAYGENVNNDLEIIFTMNNGDIAENNYHLWEASPAPVISTPEQFEIGGGYAFVVIE